MVEGVVVVSELRALVVQVDLLLAVEFALELVGYLGGGNSVPEVIDLVLDLAEVLLGTGDHFVEVDNFVNALLVHLAPAPESVVLTYAQKELD